MSRAIDLTSTVGCCALAYGVYKVVELGPYEPAALVGRCFHIFFAAAVGYL